MRTAEKGQTHADVASRARGLFAYVAVAIAFGVVLVKGELVSWYRIPEMFRFHGFHMYGVLGSAMVTALVSLEVLERIGARALSGDRIDVPRKHLGKG